MSSNVLTVLMLVAAFCLIGLLVMQGMEISYYGADPSLWPPQ